MPGGGGWAPLEMTDALEGENLPLFFQDNPLPLSELLGYVESTGFCEIWPEHSLIDKEQKCVGKFF